MQLDDSRSVFLARVASLYYDQNKSQQEIAKEFGVSRSAVSRFLTEARERGIVEIIVHYPWRTSSPLEQELISTFGLKAARVLKTEDKSYEEMLQGIGTLAAQFLDGILQDEMIIGISWGTALYQVIRAMHPKNLPTTEIVQLIGATGSENVPTDGPILAQLLTNRLGGVPRYLHAPLIVENETVRETLLQTRNIQETLARAERVNVALVGIGCPHPDLYSLIRSGYVNEQEAQSIRAAGAVGDICAQHYSITGEWLEIDINHRVVGVSLETLSNVDTIIGVAGGSQKGAAILGALRGKHVNVLITDEQAAQEVLTLHQANS